MSWGGGGSSTDLSLNNVLFEVLCLIRDPEHGHRKGQIHHHLHKTQPDKQVFWIKERPC